MEFRVVIPARYGSKRLPGKVLMDIAGKPMMQHVYERAMNSGADSVVIATDDERVREVAEGFGAHVLMTDTEHENGTERLAEVVTALGYEDDDIVVNVQCDVPTIPSDAIRQVAEDLVEHDNVKIATLCEPIEHSDELMDRNLVKVVCNKRGYALYFTRASVPWSKDKFPPEQRIELGQQHYRHIGIYAYRVGFLQQYVEWEPCAIEQIEGLEQLRVLYNCAKIHVGRAKERILPGIDTQEQLDELSKMMK